MPREALQIKRTYFLSMVINDLPKHTEEILEASELNNINTKSSFFLYFFTSGNTKF